MWEEAYYNSTLQKPIFTHILGSMLHEKKNTKTVSLKFTSLKHCIKNKSKIVCIKQCYRKVRCNFFFLSRRLESWWYSHVGKLVFDFNVKQSSYQPISFMAQLPKSPIPKCMISPICPSLSMSCHSTRWQECKNYCILLQKYDQSC